MDIYLSRDEIRAHAIEEATRYNLPHECCGLVVRNGSKQKSIRCRNASTTPEHSFLIMPDEFRNAEAKGDLLAAYHSHTLSGPEPSAADKTVSEANKLPFIIYSWSADLWDVYRPSGWRAQLEERPFFHGILDCYTLVRDYYDEVCGIKLDDFEREDDWWKKGPNQKNLYLDNVHAQGFVQVNELHVHDLLLIQWLADVPNHAAVYSEPGIILHHPPGHLSGRSPYGGYYLEHTYGIYRHKSLM
jgi:proteasome lid subunit RPN8/RPN11